MRKHLYTLLFLLAIFACDDADQMLTPFIPDPQVLPEGMVLIPAGEVQIGLSQAQFERHIEQYSPSTLQTLEYYTVQRKSHLPATALPQQTVYVDAFYMDTHEVTWEQYLAFVEASGYESKRVKHILNIYPDLVSRSGYFGKKPITQLSVAEMKAYAEFYGKVLPTEIEWEKAARGGLEDMNYPWGNTIEPAHANYNHAGIRSAFDENNKAILSSVEGGKYPPNGYGLFDMAGNVSEYVATEWDDDTYGLDQVIMRGGDYRRTGFTQQVWYRTYHTTGIGFGSMGFRCVKRF